ncbi:right-handed parallel beta-helix repeat-containing protein [Chloroflexota bacterium]
MLLKNDKTGEFLSKILGVIGRYFWNRKTFIFYIIVIFFIGLIMGMGISGFFGTIDNPSPKITGIIEKSLSSIGISNEEAYNIVLGIQHEKVKLPLNYYQGLMSRPDHIDIDIKFEDFQKLAYKREIALANGILISSDEDYVPANIHYQDKTVAVKIRLKGDWGDHFAWDKWSLRVNVKGEDTLFGMKIFSLQSPITREYVNEWLFHQALRKEDVINLRYEFVDVSINGEHKGIYAVEESFERRLIEHNNLREGPILKFDESILWADLLENKEISAMRMGNTPTGLQSMSSAGVDLFRENYTFSNEMLAAQFIQGQYLLEAFRNGELKTHQVFDVQKLARYIAITDLMGSHHALAWINMRFYYNPITGLLEPIGFDAHPGLLIGSVIGGGLQMETSYKENTNSDFISMVFTDIIFVNTYYQELERFSQKPYLDNLFTEVNDGLQRNIAILHRDYPWYYFPKETFYRNQELIRGALNPVKAVRAYFSRGSMNSVFLTIGNIQSLPVEIGDIVDSNGQILRSHEGPNVLQAKPTSQPINYEQIEFALPEGYSLSAEAITNLKISYQLMGTGRWYSEEVQPWPNLIEESVSADIVRDKPNVTEFNFISVDTAARRIVLKHGEWELTRNLIIPEGYTVVGGQGTHIDLKNNAQILSYSPVQLIGSEDNPIIVTSSDSSGLGIAILKADGPSILKNVIFQNLAVPLSSGWGLTGAITFYESPVTINNCQFITNTTGDDMLNIVRSEFTITDSLFRQSMFDALDLDYSKGSISHTSFIDSGNDGIDISGSVISITDSLINGTGDKGVSVGEDSLVTMQAIEIRSSYLAIASKDSSWVSIDGAVISDCEIGLAVYQKKPEFGPSTITATAVKITGTSTTYLVEERSTLSENDRKIEASAKEVYRSLYGDE